MEIIFQYIVDPCLCMLKKHSFILRLMYHRFLKTVCSKNASVAESGSEEDVVAIQSSHIDICDAPSQKEFKGFIFMSCWKCYDII